MSTVRISEPYHQMLRDLAERERVTLQSMLERIVELYRREDFLERTNRAFAALRADPEAWAREQVERDAWDETLADVLTLVVRREGPDPR